MNLVACFLFLVCARAGIAQQATTLPIIEEFDAAVEQGVKKDGGGCVMVAVFKGNEIVWKKGFGLADVEKRIPATAETIGRTGSISKSFTAVAICQLAERGILRLDDPVAKHFPEIENLTGAPDGSQPITYRMLASHTAGLAREPANLREAASGPIELWEEKIIAAIPKTSYKSKPMTEYSYSNIGSGILGLAGSRAAKQPFMSLVEERIIEPLKMNSTTFIVATPEMKERLAVGYIRIRKTGELDSTLPTKEHRGRGYKVPNGGIYSTVSDLAKFAAAMMGETDTEILNEQTRSDVFTPQLPAKEYGLGFRIESNTDQSIVGHGGSVAGYRADLRFDLKSKWGVATLRTTSYDPPVKQLLLDLIKED